MADEDVIRGILTYLEKNGPTNTFRLSSVMGIDRAKLLSLLKKLEEKQAIRFEHGNAVFIKSISKEKPAEVQKTSLLPEKAVRRKPAKSKALQSLQTENTQLQLKLSKLKETVKELEKKAHTRPKTITRTITKTVVKTVPVTKTVIKKVPVIKTVVKKIYVHPSPLPAKKEKKTVKKRLKLPSFKMPSFTFMKNIGKLKTPEFVK